MNEHERKQLAAGLEGTLYTTAVCKHVIINRPTPKPLLDNTVSWKSVKRSTGWSPQ